MVVGVDNAVDPGGAADDGGAGGGGGRGEIAAAGTAKSLIFQSTVFCFWKMPLPLSFCTHLSFCAE